MVFGDETRAHPRHRDARVAGSPGPGPPQPPPSRLPSGPGRQGPASRGHELPQLAAGAGRHGGAGRSGDRNAGWLRLLAWVCGRGEGSPAAQLAEMVPHPVPPSLAHALCEEHL